MVILFSTHEREQFDEELSSHNPPTSNGPEMPGPSGANGTENNSEYNSVNSQGRIRTCKYRNCTFESNIALDYWNHRRTHIQWLMCPECPFVTEYKHHLENHIKNRCGSKPLKCNICPYTCVNMSMLQSHCKSHSNVYRYRCESCTYISQYCHSLKIHLKKYNHQSAMVLNPDDTPNPHPIIAPAEGSD